MPSVTKSGEKLQAHLAESLAAFTPHDPIHFLYYLFLKDAKSNIQQGTGIGLPVKCLHALSGGLGVTPSSAPDPSSQLMDHGVLT